MSAAAASVSIADRNAANAQHSTGPVTAEGKARSARNSLRHGLTSRTIVLAHESQEDYEALRILFQQQYQPGTGVETHMLNRMVDCWWKLVRADRIEAEFFAQRGSLISENDPGLVGDAAFISIFCEDQESRNFRLFMRYYTNAQKSWRTALSEYTETRRARLQRQLEDDMLQAMMDARTRQYEADQEQAEEEVDAEDPEAPTDKPEPELEIQEADKATPAGFVSHPLLPPEPERPIPGLPRTRR